MPTVKRQEIKLHGGRPTARGVRQPGMTFTVLPPH